MTARFTPASGALSRRAVLHGTGAAAQAAGGKASSVTRAGMLTGAIDRAAASVRCLVSSADYLPYRGENLHH
jgi:hypothetical protein